MPRTHKYSPELRERAVRIVLDHAAEYPSQWAAMRSIAEKLGRTVEALRRWVRQAERDRGARPGQRDRRLYLHHWESSASSRYRGALPRVSPFSKS